MSNLRRPKRVLWIVVAVSVALPASALGAVTIGSSLYPTPVGTRVCGLDGCTTAHGALPAPNTASGGILAPTDGVVVRWRIKTGSMVTPATLRITRQGSKPFDDRTGAGTSPTVPPAANQISTFDVRLPIRAGDTVGLDCCQLAAMHVLAATPGASAPFWVPPLVDEAVPLAPTGDGPDIELLVNADIEPDADSDGFGDETQDGCPADRLRHDDCSPAPDTDPPETAITKGAPNKTDKPKVKFKFTSDEPGSRFECSLKGRGLDPSVKQFGDCGSPRKYKRLADAKFKFQVRAIDAAGNVDPSPAKDKFKVVD
jgi:hypothetical protein